MKLRAILLFLLIGGINTSFSQTVYNTEEKDSTNIYFKALKIYCKNINKTPLREIIVYVEKDYLVTEKLPNIIDGLEILYLDGIELKKKIKQNRGKLTLVKIIPLRIKKTEFFINVIPFEVSYKRKHFDYINSGGLTVKYQYNSELNGLTFMDFKWGGI